jgi:flavin-dependent dehydrogenase
VRVTRVELRGRRRNWSIVHAEDAEGRARSWQARFVLDASGRDTLLARQLGLKRKNPRHQSAAVFGHFRDVVRRPGADGGNIGIYWFRHGWFWVIPLREGVTSVGAVCWPEYLKSRSGDLASFLRRTIALCPEVQARMERAVPCDIIRATGNYSYRAHRMTGHGFVLLGDAFAFIDPVFSTGVFLAMNSAVLGAEAVDACLHDPAAERRALRRFERRVGRGLETLSWFIYRFTTPAMRYLFMNRRNLFRVEEAIISLLAGDVFRDTPIRSRLTLFKVVYWLNALMTLDKSWASFLMRRRNVAERFAADGTSREAP